VSRVPSAYAPKFSLQGKRTWTNEKPSFPSAFFTILTV